MNKVHIVKKGDTLWKISRHYNIDIHKLVEWNKLYGRKKHIIFPEQKIYLFPQKEEEIPETYLTIQILDLGFHPIKKAKLILEFDGRKQNVTCDENGKITNIEIMHHEQGLKVHFQKYDKSYDLIAYHKRLPIGKKKLTITSRTLKIDGKTLSKKGAQHDTVQSIKQETKNKNADTILKPSSSNTKSDTPVQRSNNNVDTPPHETSNTHTQNVPHPQDTSHQSSENPVKQKPRPAQPSQPHVSTSKPVNAPDPAQHTSSAAPTVPTKQPEKVAEVVRTEGGKPTYNIAQIFSEKNLLLHPDNDKYRKFIITAANKYGFTPQALAALISAEAALVKGTKEWNAKSYNDMKAGGLTQALEDTWLDACKGLGELKRTLVYERVQSQNIQSRTEKLNLRFNPELSIDFAPAYVIYNINIFKKTFNMDKVEQLPPEDKAKLAYLAHHEGAGGAYKLIMSTKNYTWGNLQNQAGKSAVPTYQKLFPNDPTNAYRYWMAHYIDSKIVVTNFMVNKGSIKVKSMEEIIVSLGGKPLVYPKGVSRNQNQQQSAPTNNNLAPAKPLEDEVKFDVIFQDKTTKKPVANLQYNLVSPYGNKSHTTDSQGRESGLGAKVGDKIEFVVNKQTVGTAKIVKNQLPILVIVDANNHQPQPPTQQSVQQPLPSGLSRWHDPLDRCVIRTQRISSPKKSTFGYVRNGGKRSHGGVDFEAAPGTPIKAVADGRVIHIREAYHDFGDASFGAFVILQCQLDDLPEPQKTVARKNVNGEFVWFFYAHLSEIDPKLKQFPDVSCGQVLGKTGFSGNAGGTKPPMNTIKNGAHLHFEARTIGKERIAKGLGNRFDPLPFFPYIKQP